METIAMMKEASAQETCQAMRSGNSEGSPEDEGHGQMRQTG